MNSSKPQFHGFFIVEKKAEEKQGPFKVDFEDPRQGEGRRQEMRTPDANLRLSVWDQRILDGPNKERARQSSVLHMCTSSVHVRFPLPLDRSCSQSLSVHPRPPPAMDSICSPV